MSTLILAITCLVVGFLCGCTSIGGILLIPVLAACTDLGVHGAMGTALFSFGFTAMLGTALHWRHGVLDWRYAIPLCLGAIPFGYAGAFVKEILRAGPLNVIFAVLIIIAGTNTLCPVRSGRLNIVGRTFRLQQIALFILGGGVGFIAGLTGAGGPVLSVPLMIIAGFPPLLSVAVAQPFQVAAALSGSVGNFLLGTIDLVTALWITPVQLVGVAMGVALANRLNTAALKRLVALMCVGTGAYLLIRAFISSMS